jgi:cobalamin synthase
VGRQQLIKAKKDIAMGIALFGVSIVYILQTFSIRQTALIKITSAAIPRVCAVVLCALSIVLTIQGVRAYRKNRTDSRTVEERKNDRMQVAAVVIALTILAIGIFLMEYAGFCVGMAVYLFFAFFTLSKYEKKNYPLFVALSLLIPVVIFLIFTKGFGLSLPVGVLGIGG